MKLQEECESNRDWADKNLVLSDVERYYEQLMGELENRESHFSSVQDRGKYIWLFLSAKKASVWRF